MSTNYYLISDATKEGYDLGSGPWYEDDVSLALWSADPAGELTDFLNKKCGLVHEADVAHQARVVRDIVAFCAQRPDWRIISEHHMIMVVDDEKHGLLVSKGWNQDDLYREVGSCFSRREP